MLISISQKKIDDIDDIVQDFSFKLNNNNDIPSCVKTVYEDLDPMKAYLLFQMIKDEDIILFDMDSKICKPADMILTSLPVPPNIIRPTVQAS